jgi:hypothetical protein
MSEQKQNDPGHWRNKLEEAWSLQGQLPLDKNAAWEKLQFRLEKKPVRNFMVLYWVAAIVFILLAIPFLMKKNKSVPVISKNTTKSQQTTQALNNKSTNDKVNESILNPPGFEKKKSVVILKNQHNQQKISKVAPLEKLAIIYTVLPGQTPEVLVIPAIRSIDTTSAITIAITTKKKLKTVHINELDPPDDQLASIIRHKGSYSDIRFGSRLMNNTAPVTQSSDYASIFKIKF